MTKRKLKLHLVISAHGYGHLTQTMALLYALERHVEISQLSIQCAHPKAVLNDFLSTRKYIHITDPSDVGLVQDDPLRVNRQASYSQYQAFHMTFDARVEAEQKRLKALAPDLICADIPYITFEAAQSMKIPTVAIASLSWEHIIDCYFDRSQSEVMQWYHQACNAYSKADLAILPTPAMVPISFKYYQVVEPFLIKGQKLANLRHQLGIATSDNRPLVLCSLGGIPSKLPLNALRRQVNFHWLISQTGIEGENLHDVADIGFQYRDIIASVDAVVAKPGYGMSVESAGHGVPMLFARRGDFPDEPVIIDWLRENALVAEISLQQWLAGDFSDSLTQLLAAKRRPRVSCMGANQAARLIIELMRSR